MIKPEAGAIYNILLFKRLFFIRNYDVNPGADDRRRWVSIMEIDRKDTQPNKRWLEIALGVLMAFFGLLGLWLSIWVTYVYLTKENVDKIIFLFVFAVFPVGIFCLFTAWRLFHGKSKRKDKKLISPVILFIFGLFFLFNSAAFYYGNNWVLASIASVSISIICFIQTFRKPIGTND